METTIPQTKFTKEQLLEMLAECESVKDRSNEMEDKPLDIDNDLFLDDPYTISDALGDLSGSIVRFKQSLISILVSCIAIIDKPGIYIVKERNDRDGVIEYYERTRTELDALLYIDTVYRTTEDERKRLKSQKKSAPEIASIRISNLLSSAYFRSACRRYVALG